MFLSIVVPSYNQGHFIETCLKSIFSQKIKVKFEVIIVDNFSKDKTKEIINKYKKKYRNIFFFRNHLNQALAINFGISKSKGKYVAFQNCDDFYNKNAFIKFYDHYLAHKDSDIIYGNMDIVNYNGKFMRFLHFEDVNYYQLASEGMIISNQSSIFKKSLFPKYKLSNYNNSFDFELFLKLAKDKKKFSNIKSNLSLASFRVYPGQKSFKYSKKDLDIRNKIYQKFKIKRKSYLIYFINKSISKLLRAKIIIKNNGLKYFCKYIFQKNPYKII
jgi:glycosyltransferase involved in cell wall biosynthesis